VHPVYRGKRCVEIFTALGDEPFFIPTMEIMLERNHIAMRSHHQYLVPEEHVHLKTLNATDGVGKGPLKLNVQMWRECIKHL